LPSLYDCFKMGIPCVFLSTGICQIYEWRPIVCRYYFSIDDPDKCQPGRGIKKLAILDAHEQAARAMAVEVARIIKENPHIPIPGHGPIPAMLIWASATVLTGRHKRWAENRLGKLPPFEGWLEMSPVERKHE
jgi:hypothetical protein